MGSLIAGSEPVAPNLPQAALAHVGRMKRHIAANRAMLLQSRALNLPAEVVEDTEVLMIRFIVFLLFDSVRASDAGQSAAPARFGAIPARRFVSPRASPADAID
jgi:hypothetical protein